jgi:TfoX/Sxy family transcriptional regulator of competence genes
MAYDERLAARIRELIGRDRDVTEKAMFGGLAFLINGNMAVSASGQGGLMLRCDPDATDPLVTSGKASVMRMRGRAMDGWLRVPSENLTTKAALAKWVDVGTTYARSLPPKRK